MHTVYLNDYLSISVCNADSIHVQALANWILDQFDGMITSYSGEYSHTFAPGHLLDLIASVQYFTEETGIDFQSPPAFDYDPTEGRNSGRAAEWYDRTTDDRELERLPYAGGFTGGFETP